MLLIIMDFADTGLAVVDRVLSKELVVVCEQFRENKMIVNPKNCEGLVLSLSLFVEVLPYHLIFRTNFRRRKSHKQDFLSGRRAQRLK